MTTTNEKIKRFTLGERSFHWGNALAVLFLLATGASLWLHLDHYKHHGPHYLLLFHVWLGGGGLIGVALLFAALGWRRVRQPARFNSGQRANLRLFQGFLGWMAFSGLLIFNHKWLGVPHATSEIFSKLHLIAAGVIGVLVLGHLAMVFLVPKNRGILGGMLSGSVDRDVASRVDPEWVAALASTEPGEQASA